MCYAVRVLLVNSIRDNIESNGQFSIKYTRNRAVLVVKRAHPVIIKLSFYGLQSPDGRWSPRIRENTRSYGAAQHVLI